MYQLGNAIGWLGRTGTKTAANHALSGRLYLAKSGWLLLSVPNALVRGLFDALVAPGAELPLAGTMNVPNVDADLLNAHISVMTADEVQSVGADKINERGHNFGYTLGPLKEIIVRGINGVSKVWAVQVSSPGLTAIRKSYGLSPLPKGHPFHITVAVRKKNVLGDNEVRKAAAAGPSQVVLVSGHSGAGKADDTFPKKELTKGIRHEHEHTDNNQIAKKIAKDHLSEDSAYYDKQEKIEKAAQPEILKDLLAAKEHSDNKRYDHKSAIIRRLMEQSPDDWIIDDAKPKYKGITHRPTNFRLHIHPTVIPAGVKAAANSVYLNELRNSVFGRGPFAYNTQKPVFENIRNHMAEIKRRGDWILQSQRNNQSYQSFINLTYRHQLALQAFHGNMPQPSIVDQTIERFGGNFLGTPR